MTQPYAITDAEWAEIGAIQDIRDQFGVGDDEDFLDHARGIYGVKFKYMEDGPGYAGDLYILQGGALIPEGPLTLIRNRAGKVALPEFINL